MYTKFELKTDRVKSLSFHSKCYWILVAFHNGLIRLYDYATGNLIETFEGHEGPVRAVSFHKTLYIFVSGGDDYLVKVWNWRQKRCLFDLKGHADYVRTAVFHDENPWIASASDDQTIRIWNWQSRSCIAVLTGHNHYVMCAQFHPKEDLLISASLDQTARIWNISGLKSSSASNCSPANEGGEVRASQGILDSIISIDLGVKFIIEGHENGVNWAEFHPVQPLIVTASDDKTVRMWRISGSQVWETDVFRGHSGNVSCVTCHPTQDIIISNSEDKTLKVWNLRKKIAQNTIKQDNSRFWTIARHPTLNLFAAGHDTGFFIFKLDRERPAYYVLDKAFIYVDNRNVRIYDYASKESRVLYTLPNSIKSTLGTPRTLSYNPSERAFLLSSSGSKCSYQMFSFKNHDFDNGGIPNAGEIYRGTGLCATFIAKNRLAVLDKNSTQQVIIKDLKNVILERISLPSPNARSIYYISGKNILVVSSSSLYLCNIDTCTVSAVLSVQDVKHVCISHDKSKFALIAPKKIIIVNSNLEVKCSLQTDADVKSGTWRDSNIFVFNNAHHIKYILENGDSGVIFSITAPIYLVRIIENTLTYITSKMEVNSIELNFTECVFKCNVVAGNDAAVQEMIVSTNLVGQAIIGYMRDKGHFDIPLDFIKDPKSKFDMAISCRNFKVAYDTAVELNEVEIWETLGQEALKYRNVEISEIAFQKSKNLHTLNTLYIITGNIENLSKMLPVYLSLNDYSSAYINALLTGDVSSQISVLSKTKKPKSNGNDKLAQTVLKNFELETAPFAVESYIPKHSYHIGLNPNTNSSEHLNINSSDNNQHTGTYDSHKEIPNTSKQLSIPQLSQESELEIDKELDSNWEFEIEDSKADYVETASNHDSIKSSDAGSVEVNEKIEIHTVTLIEAMDYSYKVMKSRRGIVVDKFQSHMDKISTAFEPFEIDTNDGLSSELFFYSLHKTAESTLKMAQSLFSSGYFNDSLGMFRETLVMAAISSVNCENDKKLNSIIRDASLYALGLIIEITRRRTLSELSPKRNMELSAYLTSCVKIPEHSILTLRSAITTAKTLGLNDHVEILADRILKLNPSKEVSEKVNNILTLAKKSKKSSFTIDFDYDDPDPICAASFTTIYELSKTMQCRYCKSLFKKEFAPDICSICEMALVE